ncbi:hypothetical protein [Nonomuraea salmonea]|uniref:hypothetical protein n=1 Tax=Nonomuraea salmonea TaxID=46181 RepID=UPI002FE9261F
MRLPRSFSGWTIGVFGVLAFALGLLGLLSPGTMLTMLGFEVPEARAAGDYTLVYLAASSMAAVNMGAYYVFAACADYVPFFRWTVPFRLVTFTVFTTLVVTGGRAGRVRRRRGVGGAGGPWSPGSRCGARAGCCPRARTPTPDQTPDQTPCPDA